MEPFGASATAPEAHDIHQVLHRVIDAVRRVEGRLRCLELIVAAGHDRFVGLAVDEYEQAAERLRVLEVTRSMAFVGAGLSEDAGADDVIRRFDDADGNLAHTIEELRHATGDLDATRRRTHDVVARASSRVRARSDARQLLAGAALA